MARAERRNISIGSPDVNAYLDRQQNVSKFIENLVLEHMEKQKVDYATLQQLNDTRTDLEEVRDEIEILNKNFLATKDVLEQVARFMKGDCL